MEIDRRLFIAGLGGAASVSAMGHEDRAEAMEDYLSQQLEAALGPQSEQPAEQPAEQQAQQQAEQPRIGQGIAGPEKPGEKFPTVAELEAQNEGKSIRRGAGDLLVSRSGGPVKKLAPMPAQPTLHDFFNLRFTTVNHVLQSANRAKKTGMSEEVILACLLHDVVQSMIKVDHGWWGAQMFEPYVPEKVAWAIRYHQALRFYPDHEAGYEYPVLYKRLFGVDYEPPPHIEAAYKYARNHKWYMEARLVTVNDLYAFDPNEKVSLEPFLDIVGRHFKQPKEGLGYDNSPVAHMWRTMINPDAPL
ncbi:MAG TPA: HD domain-containing protein [Bryobacteraceae bacterium]|nr:HD domain-containing protein [Bryobacteraceae bacterium]